MSVFSQNLLLSVRLPLSISKRFRGKINIQRPRQPHYDRARVLSVTAPIYPKPDKKVTCFNNNEYLKKLNPYDDIVAREVLNWFNHSKMVAIFHLNSATSDDLFKIKVALHKENMHLKSYGKKIIQKAVQNTKYEAVLQLFESNHCIVFSTEENVSKLLKLTKKVPQMILLAGIVQNSLLNNKEFVEFSKLPNLTVMRSQLVSLLNMPCSNLINTVESHQNSFVNILDVYAKETSEVDKQDPSNEN